MIFDVKWTRVVDKLPEDGKDYLVWTGSEMIVSMAHVYDEEHKKRLSDLADEPLFTNQDESIKKALKNATGKFADFGLHWYFDNPEVYYAELPPGPHYKEPPPQDPFEGMEERSVYLTKDGVIIGIHAIGYPGPYEWTEVALDGTETKKQSDFMQMEIWGNEYNEDHDMLGRGSFRVFDQLESEVKNWEADGWVQREAPKKKEKV